MKRFIHIDLVNGDFEDMPFESCLTDTEMLEVINNNFNTLSPMVMIGGHLYAKDCIVKISIEEEK